MKINYKAIVLFGIAILIFINSAYCSEVDDVIKRGDALYSERYLNGKLVESITIYESVYNGNEKNVELNWKLARSYSALRDYTRYNRDTLLLKYKKGEQYAKQATDLDPKSADAWLWYASILGKAGLTRGVLESLFVVGSVEEGFMRTIQLDKTKFEAYFGLAVLYRNAPPIISVGDIQKSVKYIEMALKLKPENPGLLLEAALDYKEAGDWKKANHMLIRLFALQSNDGLTNSDIKQAQKWGEIIREEIRRH